MNVSSLDNATQFVTADGSLIRELFGPATTPGRNQSLAEATIPTGQATQRHYHRDAEEIYFIVAGAGRMELDGVERDVAPGDAILIPPGAWHQITTVGDEALRLLCACSPPYRHEDTFFS